MNHCNFQAAVRLHTTCAHARLADDAPLSELRLALREGVIVYGEMKAGDGTSSVWVPISEGQAAYLQAHRDEWKRPLHRRHIPAPPRDWPGNRTMPRYFEPALDAQALFTVVDGVTEDLTMSLGLDWLVNLLYEAGRPSAFIDQVVANAIESLADGNTTVH